MNSAQKFFFAHAGYSYDPRAQTPEQGRELTARKLAEAEEFAQTHGGDYEWTPDPDGCMGCECGAAECACFTGTPHETLCCLLRGENGEVLASLGGICEPSQDYGRVIEAELALEAMHTLIERSTAMVI